MSVKGRAILYHKFIGDTRDMLNYFVQAKIGGRGGAGSSLFESLTGSKTVCITKVIKRSCFKRVVSKWSFLKLTYWLFGDEQ